MILFLLFLHPACWAAFADDLALMMVVVVMIMMMMSTFIAQDSINLNAQCSEGGDRVIRPDSVSSNLFTHD